MIIIPIIRFQVIQKYIPSIIKFLFRIIFDIIMALFRTNEFKFNIPYL